MLAKPGLDVRFCVRGIPLAKGNMSGFPVSRQCKKCLPGRPCGRRFCAGGRTVGVSVTDQGDKALKAWQGLVHYEAISARNKGGYRMLQKPGALAVSMVFVMPRPDRHWNGKELTRAGREIEFPTSKPDVDKVCRAILDALTEAVVADDSMVVVAKLAMVYEDRPRGWTGVTVHARHLTSLDAWVEHELAYHGVWSPPSPSRQAGLI
jgi:Holliday junction resolvase RusA-like endonuclease